MKVIEYVDAVWQEGAEAIWTQEGRGKRAVKKIARRRFLWSVLLTKGHAVAHLVDALHYKPEDRGFDWKFSLT
jgi:predicted CoA-binding protein